ncbi:hypothetical protein MTO96_038357 [Rhipicephalus appendiculatus]
MPAERFLIVLAMPAARGRQAGAWVASSEKSDARPETASSSVVRAMQVHCYVFGRCKACLTHFLAVSRRPIERSAGSPRRALSTKYLQSVLAVPYLSDFLVILAEAEKLRPGLSRYVLPPT